MESRRPYRFGMNQPDCYNSCSTIHPSSGLSGCQAGLCHHGRPLTVTTDAATWLIDQRHRHRREKRCMFQGTQASGLPLASGQTPCSASVAAEVGQAGRYSMRAREEPLPAVCAGVIELLDRRVLLYTVAEARVEYSEPRAIVVSTSINGIGSKTSALVILAGPVDPSYCVADLCLCDV